MIEFISSTVINGKRPHELLMLKMLAENKAITCDSFKAELNEVGEAYREEDYNSAVRVLNKEFMNTQSVILHSRAAPPQKLALLRMKVQLIALHL